MDMLTTGSSTVDSVLKYSLGAYAFKYLYDKKNDYDNECLRQKIKAGIANGTTPDVVIIGGGFSGMDAAIKFLNLGIPFTIIEKNKEFGGTWFLNTYPGCACDVPAHLYSFSYELNPNWSKPYAEQGEILEYIKKVASKYNLYKHAKLGVEAQEIRWVEEQKRWNITCSDGSVFTPRILIGAQGPLHFPKMPEIEGIETFKGQSVHSASWDPKLDYKGKKVVCVGSAASAVQLIPHVAKTAKDLYVVQRTPNWIAPQYSPVLPPPSGYPRWLISLFNFFPFLVRLHRWMIYCSMEGLFTPLGLFGDPKTSIYAQIAQAIVRTVLTLYMKSHLGNSQKAIELQDKVIPKYPVGCKRIIRSQVYLEALVKDNVHLKTDLPKLVKPNSVVLQNGEEIEADVIIWATGFEVGSFGKLRLIGSDNQVITGNDAIEKGVEAYYGMTIPKFPNGFLLVGPNTGLGHNSIILMIENEVNYIVKVICEMVERKAARVEVKESVLLEYSKWLNQSLTNSVWSGNCNSWYQGKDGKIPTLWPSSTVSYWYSLRTPNMDDYKFSS